jgi:arylsulfatase A-like enzyme
MQRCTKQEDVIWKAALRIRASTVAPKHMQAVKDGLRDQYHHAINIVPTILELFDITLPESIKGVQPPYQFEGGTIKKVYRERQRRTRAGSGEGSLGYARARMV